MAFVLVGVCTIQRPILLEECLMSLTSQEFDEKELSVEIVVVDNDAHPNNRRTVQKIAKKSPVKINYVHEPRRGIAQARNTILDKAIELKADYVAMIDDDETADKHWLASLMATEYREVAIVAGVAIPKYPVPRPYWAPEKIDFTPRFREGEIRPDAFTNNVRFSSALMTAGLRFNEKLALTGGEDSLFFKEAIEAGFEIKQTNKAKTFETIHPSRLTFKSLIGRRYWIAAVNMRILAWEIGWYKTISRRGKRVVPIALVGFIYLFLAPFALLSGHSAFKKFALRGGTELATAAGRVAAMLGAKPQPYQNIDGH